MITFKMLRDAIVKQDTNFIDMHREEICALPKKDLQIIMASVVDKNDYFTLLHLKEAGIDFNSFKTEAGLDYHHFRKHVDIDKNDFKSNKGFDQLKYNTAVNLAFEEYKEKHGGSFLDLAASRVTFWDEFIKTAITLRALRVNWNNANSSRYYKTEEAHLARNRNKVEELYLSRTSNLPNLEKSQEFISELFLYACENNLTSCVKAILATEFSLSAVEIEVRQFSMEERELARIENERMHGTYVRPDLTSGIRNSESSASENLQRNMLRGLTAQMMAPLQSSGPIVRHEPIQEEVVIDSDNESMTEEGDNSEAMSIASEPEINVETESKNENVIMHQAENTIEPENKNDDVTMLVSESNMDDEVKPIAEPVVYDPATLIMPIGETIVDWRSEEEKQLEAAEAKSQALRSERQDAIFKHGDAIININVKNEQGLTGLHVAAARGYLGIVELLISLDALPESTNTVVSPAKYAFLCAKENPSTAVQAVIDLLCQMTGEKIISSAEQARIEAAQKRPPSPMLFSHTPEELQMMKLESAATKIIDVLASKVYKSFAAVIEPFGEVDAAKVLNLVTNKLQGAKLESNRKRGMTTLADLCKKHKENNPSFNYVDSIAIVNMPALRK